MQSRTLADVARTEIHGIRQNVFRLPPGR